jgi:Zn-dependent peptidase ImmA (M78 family)
MKTNKKQLWAWAKQINREIFGNSINLEELRIINKKKDKDNPQARAWFYPQSFKIVLIAKEHRNEFEIFHTLAHELIHVYQLQCNCVSEEGNLNHGGKFFRFYKEKICAAYEIDNDWMF